MLVKYRGNVTEVKMVCGMRCDAMRLEVLLQLEEWRSSVLLLMAGCPVTSCCCCGEREGRSRGCVLGAGDGRQKRARSTFPDGR